MNFVVFGLTVSSSWGNGHATLWRGLIRALTSLGHSVTFFERDVPYYAETRDLFGLGDGAELVFYTDWPEAMRLALARARNADVAIVTSYCPDADAASDLLLECSPGLVCYYDLDTPVTLARLDAGEAVPYLPACGLGAFDLVLSYTGGRALDRLTAELGARRVAPLYGHVDPDFYRPAGPRTEFRGDLSYIGTFAADRQPALERLFVEPARQRPDQRFVLAGAGYPADFPWTGNIHFVRHLPPPDHPAFYASSRMTLNVTRRDMARMGFCPSGRLFEAAACATPMVTDRWEGLEQFFTPGREILVAENTDTMLAILDRPPAELAAIGEAARRRVLAEHTSRCRAETLLRLVAAPGLTETESMTWVEGA